MTDKKMTNLNEGYQPKVSTLGLKNKSKPRGGYQPLKKDSRIPKPKNVRTGLEAMKDNK